jgi:hypothetical protein
MTAIASAELLRLREGLIPVLAESSGLSDAAQHVAQLTFEGRVSHEPGRHVAPITLG